MFSRTYFLPVYLQIVTYSYQELGKLEQVGASGFAIVFLVCERVFLNCRNPFSILLIYSHVEKYILRNYQQSCVSLLVFMPSFTSIFVQICANQIFPYPCNAVNAFPGITISEEPEWHKCIEGSNAVVNLAGMPISTRWSSEVCSKVLYFRSLFHFSLECYQLKDTLFFCDAAQCLHRSLQHVISHTLAPFASSLQTPHRWRHTATLLYTAGLNLYISLSKSFCEHDAHHLRVMATWWGPSYDPYKLSTHIGPH